MSTLVLLVLATMHADESGVATRYAATQTEQLKDELATARQQIRILEEEKKRVHASLASVKFIRGGFGIPFFGGRIRWYQEFIDRYEKEPLLFVPRLELVSRTIGRVGVLEHGFECVSASYGRHDFELLQVIDKITMLVKVGTLRVCVKDVGMGDANVGDRVTFKQVFETLGERQYEDDDGNVSLSS